MFFLQNLWNIARLTHLTAQGNEFVTIYNCKVDLPADKIPEWLAITEFSIIKAYKDGLTVTSKKYSPLGNIDTDLFVDEVMKHIRVNEINAKMK